VNQYRFHQIISGKTKGLGPDLTRIILRLLAIGYEWVIRIKNYLYEKKIIKQQTVSRPVICVGNLTTGGTGKTPLVAWLCRYLTQNRPQRSLRCAILTRGYKNHDTQTDETALLKKNCDVHIIVNPNRVEGAHHAIALDFVDVLIMDDGLQHRRLCRDLDIIAIDATNPFGYNRLLPAGLLREPISALKRAQCAIITRCDQVPLSELDRLETTLASTNPHLVLARSIHAPNKIFYLDGSETTVQALKGKRLFAFCGIGNPNAFFSTVRQAGATIAGTRVFNDHYHCTLSDIDNLHRQALEADAEMLLTTEKNFFDVQNAQITPYLPTGYLSVDLAFISGEDRVKELIETSLDGKICQT
jgi:tetraacyldisaccharide 4'-kinase